MVVVATPDFPDEGFHALVDAAPDGVLVVARDGTIVLANPEIRRLTGYEVGELVGQKIEMLVPAEYRPGHAAHRDRYASSPHARPMGSNLELWAMRKDGTRLAVEIMLSPMRMQGVDGTIAFVRDASERRRRQRELEESNALANAANRELEAFSYSVAHDLRTPLRSIDGFAQALSEDYGDQLDAAGRDYIARVRAAAQRMGHLIDDLLALSRISRAELHRERIELGRIAREVDTRLRAAYPDRKVELTVQPDLWIHADPRMVAIALDNLLGNAWKFTRPRATAHVEVGRLRGPDGPAYFVRDDGVGFDMKYVNSLFTPFKRLHGAREFEGTGIGLATVARVIHRHGGRIWAEAALDRGATFYFTLGPEETT